MFLYGALVGGANEGFVVLFGEIRWYLNFQRYIVNHMGGRVGVHALHNAHAIGGDAPLHAEA